MKTIEDMLETEIEASKGIFPPMSSFRRQAIVSYFIARYIGTSSLKAQQAAIVHSEDPSEISTFVTTEAIAELRRKIDAVARAKAEQEGLTLNEVLR